jgi:hypothetical protein
MGHISDSHPNSYYFSMLGELVVMQSAINTNVDNNGTARQDT